MELTIKQIHAAYQGEEILHDINISVPSGAFVSILGPSGCGKSTLLNIISGICRPTHGTIYVNGQPIEQNENYFSYMPQEDLLFPWMHILDNVSLYGRLHGKRQEAEAIARVHMEQFGLAGYEMKYPHMLSGGLRQRAAFLRTALCPTPIMLLDEPFAALDIITQSEMQDWLLQLRASFQKTTVLVTHNIEEAIYLSDAIYILGGRPASILKLIPIQASQRTRAWLFSQYAQKEEIYRLLQKGVL